MPSPSPETPEEALREIARLVNSLTEAGHMECATDEVAAAVEKIGGLAAAGLEVAGEAV